MHMITLYDYLPSQNAYKIRLLFSHLNQAYKSRFVSIFEGEGHQPGYRKISPTGAVPAIKLDDGCTLAESNAILIYLAQGTRFLPEDNFTQAKVYQWLFFEGEYVQSGIATLRHWIQTGKDKNRSKTLLNSKRELSIKTLGILDQHLSENNFLVGSQYTIADISVFAYVHLADQANLPLKQYNFVTQWISRIRSESGFLDKVYPYSIDPHSTGEL